MSLLRLWLQFIPGAVTSPPGRSFFSSTPLPVISIRIKNVCDREKALSKHIHPTIPDVTGGIDSFATALADNAGVGDEGEVG
jgi:hypothetical protein